MIKLIQGESPEKLEKNINLWISNQESDRRNIKVISMSFGVVQKPKHSGLRAMNGPIEVETIFQCWLLYEWFYVGGL